MSNEIDENDEEDNAILSAAALGSDLSWRERAMREKFAREYLVDYDSFAAAVRCGYHSSYAKEYAVKFMNEPYVLNLIEKMEVGGIECNTPEEAEAAIKKRVLQGLLREAHYKGPGSSQSARVAALSKLAQMHGMDAPTRTQTQHLDKDGNPIVDAVFVLPGVMSPEAWAAAAEAQQAALVASTTSVAQEVTKH